MDLRTHRVPIGQITQWLSGGTPNRSVAAYWNGKIPWISASTLKHIEISGSDQHVTPQAVALGSKMAPVGATLLLVRGSALYNEIRAGLVVSPVCFNQDVKALVPKPGVEPKFLTYSLLGRESDLLKLVSTAGNSAGVLDTRLVQAFDIFFPSPPEQRAIAGALSDVDGLLGALEALIAKKRAIKQAAMQQLLTGKTRLPGFSGAWETKQLGDVSKMESGGTPTSSVAAYYSGGIQWVSISDMTSVGKIVSHTERTLSSLGLENSAAQMFPRGTVLYAMYASLGECSIADVSLCTSQAILGIRPSNRLYGEFLYYWLISFRSRVKSLGQQGTQSNLNKGMVQGFKIELPPLSEQTAIATVLSDMDAEIVALEARRDKTRAIKQGMMQQLLTGRIRLVRPEAVEEVAAS